ncbi:glycosyltransferase family 4 protein [Daejeonella sp.]|uniref:glycosyltransferase family 4 protein n=1 Tax=Daejeonella sp. TaxID=2805397 RepID=UPI0030BD9965
MPKRILFLSFYFEPDLCAGSFRNSPLAYELGKQGMSSNVEVDVITTLPNRYGTYTTEALEFERKGNISIKRINIPFHQSGVWDQINSFKQYFNEVKRLIINKKYDLIFASSSRLFTAYLGYKIARERRIPLYLDIRDIFLDTIKDVFSNPLIKGPVIPIISYIESQTFNYASHINLISGGFRDYFKKYDKAQYSEYSNGIDPFFIDAVKVVPEIGKKQRTIVYAGNIGEGQGLHRVVPEAAKALGDGFKFRIIGDGGAKSKLLDSVGNTPNVEILPPVDRASLIEEYNNADFLFMHLNDYDAFKKVLPSKVFELGVFPKPLIAGVNGFSKHFVEKNLPGSIMVQPCNGYELAAKVLGYDSGSPLDRSAFINSYRRESINQKMTESILKYI